MFMSFYIFIITMNWKKYTMCVGSDCLPHCKDLEVHNSVLNGYISAALI